MSFVFLESSCKDCIYQDGIFIHIYESHNLILACKFIHKNMMVKNSQWYLRSYRKSKKPCAFSCRAGIHLSGSYVSICDYGNWEFFHIFYRIGRIDVISYILLFFEIYHIDRSKEILRNHRVYIFLNDINQDKDVDKKLPFFYCIFPHMSEEINLAHTQDLNVFHKSNNILALASCIRTDIEGISSYRWTMIFYQVAG